MLAIFYRLLAVSAVSALSWSLYQIALICRHGAVLARQFRSPPPRNKLLGMIRHPSPAPKTASMICSPDPTSDPALPRSRCEQRYVPVHRQARSSTSSQHAACLAAASAVCFCAGHVEEMTTPDAHKTALRYVKEYGANVRMRLAWHHVIVVTEVCLQLGYLQHTLRVNGNANLVVSGRRDRPLYVITRRNSGVANAPRQVQCS